MRIEINGDTLDLQKSFGIDIEDSNPLYNETGPQSIPVSVPATAHNCQMLRHPELVEAGEDPNRPFQTATISDGMYFRRGKLNVDSAGVNDGISFNIGFDNSELYAEWSDKKLNELDSMPEIHQIRPDPSQSELEYLYNYMNSLYRSADPQTHSLAVFPVLLDKESGFILNEADASGLKKHTTITSEVDGVETIVNVPENYGISPFVRVWKVLEIIFSNLGVKINNNPFKHHLSLSRLVVLNNAADAICTRSLSYRDLMPDCTVQEFLNSLWCKFGLVYNVNFTASTVDLALIKDIIRRREEIDFTNLISSEPLVTYNNPQYVKLTAATGIDGAEPQVERFEDFAKGCDLPGVHVGSNIESWIFDPERDKWDGDIRDDFFEPDIPETPDPDVPDPDFPEPDPDDNRDDHDNRDDWWDYYDGPMLASSEADVKESSTEAEGHTCKKYSPATDARQDNDNGNDSLAFEFISGNWSRLDRANGKAKCWSSPFFNWDPKPHDAEALELACTAECVPVKSVDVKSLGPQYMPAYLYGPRHYHSYIKNSKAEESGETPLAFILAYTYRSATVGRNSPELYTGVVPKEISTPGFTLYNQFRKGLFDVFWKDYDEILRHGNRSIEFTAWLPLHSLTMIDVMKPCRLRGIRCLIDKISYRLPASGKVVQVSVSLRTINTQGNYNISDEQGIPPFNIFRIYETK